MIPLLPIGLALGMGWLYLSKDEGGVADPFASANMPSGYAKAKALKTVSRTKNGRNYDVTLWDHDNGRQFCVARLKGATSWVSYWHDLKTSKRKLHRAYAPGDKSQSGRAVSVMMGDWGVNK